MNLAKQFTTLDDFLKGIQSPEAVEARGALYTIQDQVEAYEKDPEGTPKLKAENQKLIAAITQLEAKNQELVAKIAKFEADNQPPSFEIINKAPIDPPDSLM